MGTEKENKGKNYIRFDWAIKRLLRNKADFGAVNGFLSCLLKKQITISKVLESEGNKRTKDDKYNRVDILVEDERNEKFIIEIQINSQIDFYHRMLYGVSKVVCDYMKEGDFYDKIQKIYSINMVYFPLGESTDYIYRGDTEFRGIHNNEVLRLSYSQQAYFDKERVGDIYPEFYVLCINNFDKVAKNSIDQWMHFLKTTEIPDEFDAQGLDEAREKLKIDNLTPEERKAYYHHLDQKNYEEGSMLHNRLEYERKGRAEGRAEGEKLKTIEIAKNAKEVLGLSIEQIQKLTGLAKEEIEKL